MIQMCLPQLDIRKIQQRNSLSSLTETLDERDANYHFHGGKVDGWHSAFEHLPHEVSFPNNCGAPASGVNRSSIQLTVWCALC